MPDTPEVETRKAIQHAVELLRPRFKAIDSHWRSLLLENLVLTGGDIEALAGLNLPSEAANLRTGKLEAYRSGLKRKAQELEKRGIPERTAVASLGLYLESSLRFLAGERAGNLAAALSHLTATGQLHVMSGYSSQRALSWRDIEERERHRLSRDLHDEIGHSFLVLKLYLEMMRIDLGKGDIAKTSQKLEEALALVSQGVESVRRLVLDLGPAMLDELGLIPALKLYAGQFASRTGIKVSLQESNVPRNLSSAYETVLYRVIQGALSNVLKHSQATNVKMNLTVAKGPMIVLIIEDNGIGFDVTRLKGDQAFGLTAIRERIEGLNGTLRLESWPMGSRGRKHGTRIEVILPLAEEARV